jgi:hypothetical protein
MNRVHHSIAYPALALLILLYPLKKHAAPTTNCARCGFTFVPFRPSPMAIAERWYLTIMPRRLWAATQTFIGQLRQKWFHMALRRYDLQASFPIATELLTAKAVNRRKHQADQAIPPLPFDSHHAAGAAWALVIGAAAVVIISKHFPTPVRWLRLPSARRFYSLALTVNSPRWKKVQRANEPFARGSGITFTDT